VAGVSGNGQRELYEALVGVRAPSEGRVLLNGADITHRLPRHRMARGIAAIPEDRIAEGLVADFTVQENLVLGFHRTQAYSKNFLLNGSAIESFATESIQSFGIATPSPRQVTRVLSGGNLQKVILARELSRSPACLVASQATRGLDVGATEYVRRRLLEQRRRGAAIVLISEDLEEIFNLSDRIAVLFKGQIAGTLNAEDASLETVARLMAGMEGAPGRESA
jgi:simple sugar transport system ATP-binding protein